MVMSMNKEKFVSELSKQLNYSIEKCHIINNILENNFVLSKKSKAKIIDDLIGQLDIENKEATKIYDIAIKIINDEIKRKLKHPFKNQD